MTKGICAGHIRLLFFLCSYSLGTSIIIEMIETHNDCLMMIPLSAII